MLVVVAGCSQPQSKTCVGGITLDDGGCVAKCDKSKCLAGNTCVGNTCMLECKSHAECMADTQRCTAAHEDDTDAGVFICVDTDLKQNGVPCPQKTECTLPAICKTSGVGDATAYCVNQCSTDADCPGGYECGTLRDPHGICGTMKGDNNFCGYTLDECVTREQLSFLPEFFEGNLCLYRRVCLKKLRCAACTSDVDCIAPGAKCKQVGASTHCLDPCAKDSDCEASDGCSDGFCRPRFGDCTAPTPGFCTPCAYDQDCEPNFECVSLHALERSCLDMKFTTSCTTNNECPVAPSGLHGTCLAEAQGVSPGDGAYHKCYAPQDANEAFTCYPAH